MAAADAGKTSSKRTAIIAAILIIVVAVLVVLVNGGLGKKSTGEVAATYRMEIASSDNNATVFEMNFNDEDKTFQETLSVGELSQPITQGTYDVNGEEITTTSEQLDTEGNHVTEHYLTDGKYLVVKDYLYEGEVPDEDTFDATCTYTGANESTSTITFKADGTYVEDISGETTEGTYERKGDIITRTDDSGADKINFLIYNGAITNSYYIAE